MYKTDFVCTYKKFEDLADDEVNSDMLYRVQFLQVFGLQEYDGAAISAGLELIKAKANDMPELKALILQHPYSHNMQCDLDSLVPMMFAYPLLDVFHLCLIDAFVNGSISTEHQNQVLSAYDTML
jgi:hypothetical protein